MSTTTSSDAIVVGAGLAGLVAAAELVDAGKHVTILEQEPEASFGGQAWWSFGGVFLIDSPEQRRMGIKDSFELAQQDWAGTAGFDRDEDLWPRRWAQAYLDFAANEKRDWLRGMGVKFFPVVGWAERGGYTATGHGNSVPRFHIVWGTGPGILEPFVKRVRVGVEAGLGGGEGPDGLGVGGGQEQHARVAQHDGRVGEVGPSIGQQAERHQRDDHDGEGDEGRSSHGVSLPRAP